MDVQPPFSREEYEQRLKAVRSELLARQAQLLLVDESEHLFYLTGFGPSATMYQVCLVPVDRDPIMLLLRLDEPSFRERTWLRDYIVFGDAEDPVVHLRKALTLSGWADKRIAVELDSHYLPVRRFHALTAALPEATFVDFSDVLWEMRLHKSPQEVAYLRQAATIADEAMRQAIAAVGEGVRERAAAIVASRAFLELGADGGHIGRIASGGRTDSLHGALRNHPLVQGDVVHMELCPQVSGYSARLMRPTVIGTPSRAQEETARALVEIQDQQLAAMRPGAKAKDVDHICREQVLGAGLRDTYDNTTGYTLGYYGTPYPPRSSDFTRVFLPTAEWRLEPGMVCHMYTAARGMAFSETVLVTDHGHERLTQLDRCLFVR
ncbi:MAG: Xaa-Pro peptidase family protein [Chloroflexota bacterium]|nr:Xaa-Pro peptidase family protein [Chloroflexota bacterium]